MRVVTIAAILFPAIWAASTTQNGPFLRIDRTSIVGRLRVSAVNVSRHPVVAYVVVVESGHHRLVWESVHSDGSALGVRETVRLGDLPKGPTSEKATIVVDYVRLSDGEAWGKASTKESKDIISRLQNSTQTPHS